jgi:cytoskeletal protein CcmA (bactofilin family)
MLGRSKSKKRQGSIATLVGAETRVQGDIEFAGGFHIDGYVKGNVIATGEEGALLSISERGYVEGTVVAAQVLLNGTVRGDVRASERVELGPKAKVTGNVQYRLIEMAIGAEVNGQLIHESDESAHDESAHEVSAPPSEPEAEPELEPPAERTGLFGEAR